MNHSVMTAETLKVNLTAANLARLVGKTITVLPDLTPAPVGTYLGRGFAQFELRNITNPYGLGNDAFTEVYFTTGSGNLYRIAQNDEDRAWHLSDVNSNRKAHVDVLEKIKFYALTPDEAQNMVLKVGQAISYGKGGRSTSITGILAVNASRCYSRPQNPDLVSNIREEFHHRIMGLKVQ